MGHYIDRCEICGAFLDGGYRRKITVANEVIRRYPTGNESAFKARSHAIVCERCARKVERLIDKMTELYENA